MPKKLFLVDGSNHAFRVQYALPPQHASDGFPTRVLYGFTLLFQKMMRTYRPDWCVVSFDTGKSFRNTVYSEYKGHRREMPEDMKRQWPFLRPLVEGFGYAVNQAEGYEADDVLGTIARQAKAFDVPVHIITGDRDLLQLVDKNTRVELPARGGRDPEVYDETAVVDRFGVRPDQIVDWKALVGDSSDNIPGVRGVGEKTATKLLNQYETLDGIYAHLDDIKGAMGRKLAEGKESAYLSYKLARIITDAPIALQLEACVTQDFNASDVLQIFHELEFRSLTDMLLARVDDVEAVVEEATSEPPTDVVVVRSEKQLAALVQALNAARVISFDLETTSLDEMSADIVGVCLAVAPPVGYYVPVGHLAGEAQADSGQMSLFAGEATLAPDQLPLQKVLDALRGPLTNPDIPKIAHNAKYDYTILAQHGLQVAPITFDTMIAEWITDPGSKHKGLKDLARHRLGVEMTEITQLIGKGSGQKSFAAVPIDEAAPYGAADADLTLRLVKPLRNEIQEKGLEKLLDIEMPLIPVLSAMEQAGVGIDQVFFRQMSQDLAARLAALEAQLYEMAGEPFNVNSTQQLSDILFGKLGLPTDGLRKTSSGYYSTAAAVLDGLKAVDESGIIRAILEHRELNKLKSTYVDALPAMVNQRTGRIHTSFNQTGAITGRLASSSPNLQNIPIRSEVGQQIRRGFVAREGWTFLAADYSQVELRILAHVSQDAALLEAFRQDQDIHRTTAAAVYNIPADEVTFNQRRFAKAVNFGLIYGMGAYRLARDSELTLAEAENYIKAYFGRFPGIRTYLDGTKEMARKQGYVETLLGRRRYFPVLQGTMTGSNRQAWMRAEREAINHPIQGTAADIIKIAMLRLHNALHEGDFRAQMLLQVHDE
ncbi:MAG: DNA polymerase I, partial [Myxococcales bacterium]|nr:DNA polymerase I [Myxococcales bacterium]